MLPAAWHGTVADFNRLSPELLPDSLAARSRAAVPVLQDALHAISGEPAWTVCLDVRLFRLQRRIDAVLATDRAVFAIQIRPEARAFLGADRLAAEDAALDLADYHAGCRGVPVLPVVLVPNGARLRGQLPLPLAGASPVVEATRLSLPGLLRQVATAFPSLHRSGADWLAAPYAPVPALTEAACLLYARHGVASMRLAEAGPGGLARTQSAVAEAVARAQAREERVAVFVTGQPGAGKTLCGLNLAFAPGTDAAFLTGNPTLVHVLREALVRDAVARGADPRASRRRMESVIQSLPAFRDHYVQSQAPPAERVVVIDEAQRCWSRAHAISKTQNRPVKLGDSEPGHLLDIMGRRPGWSVMVCLLGGGQEIHDGEGGLAAWGDALAERPSWCALAPDTARSGSDPRQRLRSDIKVLYSPSLHLSDPIRAVHRPDAVEWVNAVLRNDQAGAAAFARKPGGVPFAVTRSLSALRAALQPRGLRTSGLVASSGARRLRAEGLGAVLPHQDEDQVARWFLDRWPDVRSGDALEVVATEFGVQGLELDRVGLCWDADLIREGGQWRARRFRGSAWTDIGADAHSNRLNAYRVLLTRARHGTVIWVPCGNPEDATRDPKLYDAVAEYLLECGANALDAVANPAEHATDPPERALL